MREPARAREPGIAFANVLYATKARRRIGQPLGNTEFIDIYGAYDALPEAARTRPQGATILHDFNKFWEEMRWRLRSTGRRRRGTALGEAAASSPIQSPVVPRFTPIPATRSGSTVGRIARTRSLPGTDGNRHQG